MKKVLIALLSVMLLATVLVGCGDKKEDEGAYKASQNVTVYGTIYGGLGYMNAQTDSKGNLIQLVLDEIFMPNDWAKINDTNGTVLIGETETAIEVVEHNAAYGTATVKVAKFIYFNGKKYTAVVNADNKGVTYKDGDTTLAAVLADAANAKKYHDTANNYYTSDKKTDSFKVGAGTDGTTQVNVAFSYENATFTKGKFVIASGNGAGASFFKRESGYWNNKGEALGLHGNYDAILKYFRTYGFDFKDSDIGDTEEGTWTIGDIDTKSTLTAFEQYIKLGRKLHTLLAK